jgi:hypothetical protein
MVMPSMVGERETPDETEPRGLGAGARALNYGASAVLTGVIMVGASLLLWIGVPAGWLWIGSQVQGSTGNVGTAIAVMLVGAVASIVALAWVLGRLNNWHEHLRAARGGEVTGAPLLEVVSHWSRSRSGSSFWPGPARSSRRATDSYPPNDPAG